VDFLPGNHEERLHRNVVEANPALHEHPALELANILQLPAGVRCHPYGHKLRVGNLVLCHGDKLLNNLERRKHGAAAVLAKYPNQHTIYGHTHRIESYGNVVYNDDRPRTFTAWNVGWLGDYRQADYVEDPSWRQGFAFVEFWRDPEGRERFTFQQLEFVDGRFSWGGKVYGR
jgi:hypothetical protein